jgi:hypothetical protein
MHLFDERSLPRLITAEERDDIFSVLSIWD